MSTPKLTIRNSRETERVAIFAVHNSAFGEEQGLAIVQLVNDLLDDETAAPMLSLVAELRGELVGHVLFTSVT
ncbi:MAG: GNAT family N-acetyltransferase, partial [Planctomycetota bacterium]